MVELLLEWACCCTFFSLFYGTHMHKVHEHLFLFRFFQISYIWCYYILFGNIVFICLVVSDWVFLFSYCFLVIVVFTFCILSYFIFMMPTAIKLTRLLLIFYLFMILTVFIPWDLLISFWYIISFQYVRVPLLYWSSFRSRKGASVVFYCVSAIIPFITVVYPFLEREFPSYSS